MHSLSLEHPRFVLPLALAVLLAGLARFDAASWLPPDGKQAISIDHHACPIHRNTDRVGRGSDLWRLAFGFCRYALVEPRQLGFARQQAMAHLSGDAHGWASAGLLSLHGLRVKLQV